MFSQIQNNRLKLGLNSEGALVISGRSVSVENQNHYDEIISKCRTMRSPVLSGTINLEYVSCASFRKIIELFEVIGQNDSILKAVISFFVDTEDEDQQEMWSMATVASEKINYQLYAR